MGKGGVSPEYFLYKMRWVEIVLYMRGMEKRELPGWRQMRMLAAMVLNGIGAKKNDGSPLEPMDIVRLPEDEPEEESTSEQSDEDYEQQMQELMHSCEEYNRKLGKQ